MSEPIVIQLQELASDSHNEIADLLRKALLVASKLNLADFRQWISNELNGYAGANELPPYRVINGDLRAQNPVHGLIPFLIEDAELMAMIRRVNVAESVSSLSHMMSDRKPGAICYFFAPEQEAMLMRMQGDFAQMRPLRVVGANQLAGILQAVRTRVLDWAISLEREGIVGDGLTFSNKEREIAMSSHSIKIENFQGVLGDVHSGGGVSQTNTLTLTAGSFDSLSRYLAGNGVQAEDLRELEKAIGQDPEPRDPKKLGPRVSGWIGKMITKAADGSWEASVSAAGTLLAAALQKFYGL